MRRARGDRQRLRRPRRRVDGSFSSPRAEHERRRVDLAVVDDVRDRPPGLASSSGDAAPHAAQGHDLPLGRAAAWSVTGADRSRAARCEILAHDPPAGPLHGPAARSIPSSRASGGWPARRAQDSPAPRRPPEGRRRGLWRPPFPAPPAPRPRPGSRRRLPEPPEHACRRCRDHHDGLVGLDLDQVLTFGTPGRPRPRASSTSSARRCPRPRREAGTRSYAPYASMTPGSRSALARRTGDVELLQGGDRIRRVVRRDAGDRGVQRPECLRLDGRRDLGAEPAVSGASWTTRARPVARE